jgi:hypothetical protein
MMVEDIVSMHSADHRGSAVTSNPADGMIKVVENALPVIFWHPWQWQAASHQGASLKRKRTRPQRQPPSMGSWCWDMEKLRQ